MNTAPRVFVGSAYARATRELGGARTDGFSTVAASAGLHLHPMGFFGVAHREGFLPRLAGNFSKNKWFTLEGDFEDAKKNPVLQRNPVEFADHFWRAAGKEWRCAAFMVLFRASSLLGDDKLDDLSRDLGALYAKARARGVDQNYVFWTPVSPKAAADHEKHLAARRDGVAPWVWLAPRVGAVGVAIDFPAGVWRMLPHLRALGLHVARTTKAAGLQFVWVLNGGSSVADTRALKRDLAAAGVTVDRWVVSHFNNDAYPAVPETGESVTGQARALL